ncbi:restriction endonuclease subunit S [Streptomyces sp. NPDC004749]
MSRIDEMLQELCPGGVVFKELGDSGTVFGGLTGKSKADFSDGNARYVSYTNVFSNIAVDVDANDFVKVESGERQRMLKYGDVIFTGSSESADEVGMTSVVTAKVNEPLYLNSFCIGFRPNGPDLLDPEFSKHLFRSSGMRSQIIKTANGVTRFNVSKARLAKVRVPMPPVEVQREIVSVLDQFTQLEADLEAELEAELEARRRQYQYYRDKLVSEAVGAESLRLGDVGSFVRGRRFTKNDVVDSGIPSIHYGEIYTEYGTSANEVVRHVRVELRNQLRYAEPGSVVFAGVGETVEDVGKAVAWLGNEPVATHDDTFVFTSPLNPKYVAYAVQTRDFHRQKERHVSRAKVKRLSAAGLADIKIPVPNLTVQEKIVETLDNFDALVKDIDFELPTEISFRRKQYEYYRDRLLTFKEAAA